jgi:methyl-accepting chemotaxis protein
MRWRLGVSAKFTASAALAVVLVAAVLTGLATAALSQNIHREFESKGMALATSLASAAEQTAGQSVSLLQGSIDASKKIGGVRYIFMLDEDGKVVVHTFSPQFPDGLSTMNVVAVGELDDSHPVKNRVMDVKNGDATWRVLDVAAPVSGGALGVVHVGMDLDAVGAQVAALRLSMLLFGGLTALVGVLLAFGVTLLSVVRPIRMLTRVAGEIVERGDLTQRIEVHSGDEVGQLASSFAKMVERLRELPRALQSSSELLLSTAGSLSLAAGEQVKVISRQAAALQQTQVTAQELKQIAVVAAERAQAVLDFAGRADELGLQGQGAIEQSVKGLDAIRAHVDEVGKRLGMLEDRARQIGSISATVKDLADQSNMLALNAAIEAVRSGEAGKGFGVVAREIRSLADQSVAATKRVRDIVEEITEAIRQTTVFAESGSRKMEEGLRSVRASGESLGELSGIVRNNVGSVRQIAAAVSQQSAGISQIFSAVTDQNEMMNETRRRMDDTIAASQVLLGASSRVQDISGRYKV